ncbi:hypothetical protein ANO11243_085680 [Dothideomycetidae sp. 11243]|nr:hypothetical protein ANO11243_085680 [fungal sp. No.11243]
MFQQRAPFEVHGISGQAIWHNGRGKPGGQWGPPPMSLEQMLFTTAVSWKDQGLTHHGYLDDTLFITFGVEDKRSGVIDVKAGDLLANIKFCRDVS